MTTKIENVITNVRLLDAAMKVGRIDWRYNMHVEDFIHIFDALSIRPDYALMLVNAPTGTGKSFVMIHSLCQYAALHPDFRAFFVTDQKKNLNESLFAQAWQSDGRKRQGSFAQKVAVLRSISDTAAQLLKDKENEAIPVQLLGPEVDAALQQLFERLRFYKMADSQGVGTTTAWRGLNDADRAVRMALANRMALELGLELPLNDVGQAKLQSYVATHTTPACEWLNTVYPTLTLENHQIIVLTTAKFITSYTPFFSSRSVPFQYSPLLKDSVVVLDEFDSTKQQIWEQAIDTALKIRVDLSTLFESLYQGLNKVDRLPSGLRELLTKKDDFQSLMMRAGELRKQYALDQLYRSDETEENSGFVIHTPQRSLISHGRAWHAHHNPQTNQVIIGSKVSDDLKFRSMLTAVSAFLRRFTKFILYRAREYQLQRDSKRSNYADGMTIREACYTIYDALGLSWEQAEVLMSLGLELPTTRKQLPGKQVVSYRRFQERGLSLFNFVNDSQHDLRTDINASFFAVTPERFLLGVLSKAHVLGLSATATVPTVLDNYDLNYLHEQLGSRFLDGMDYFSDATMQSLNLAKQYHAAGVELKVEQATQARSITELVGKRVGRGAQIDQAKLDLLDGALEEQINRATTDAIDLNRANYIRERYLRLLDSFIMFIQDSEMTSFLGLQALLPSLNSEMSQPFVEEAFTTLCELLSKKEKNAVRLCIISPRSKASISTQISAALSYPSTAETRVYLLSAYQTIGVGQNLQHPIGDMEKPLIVNIAPWNAESNDPRQGAVDLAGMYLGDVTHILSSEREFQMNASGLRLVTELEYLFDNNEIGYHTLKSQFDALQQGRWRKRPENLISVAASYSRTIIQAVGRMDRTFNKLPHLRILASANVLSQINDVGINMKTVSPEYQALINFSEISGDESNQRQAESEKQNLTLYTHRDVQGLVNHLRTSRHDADLYQDIREFIVRHPTASLQTIAQRVNRLCFQYLNNPSKVTRYAVKRVKGDHGDFDFSQAQIEVSAEAAGMKTFCRFPGLQTALDEAEIPTIWTPNEYILNPVQYINLYLGALGEFAGKFIVETIWPEIKLKKFSKLENNELFDFFVGTNIAIDFKNWNGMPNLNPQQEREHVVKKLERLEQNTGHAWTVLIMNVRAINSAQPIPVTGQRILEVPGLIDANGAVVLTPESRLMIGAILIGQGFDSNDETRL